MTNDAFLAKIGWRILKNPNCLLARYLLGKYCNAEPFLKCKTPTGAFHGWRSVLIGRDLLLKQIGWMVGTGTEISVWSDSWLSHCEQERPVGPAPERFKDIKVSDLLHADTLDWDLEKIELIVPFHKDKILRLRPSKMGNADELVWLKNPTGDYSTRSGYLTLTEEAEQTSQQSANPSTDWLTNVWRIKTAEKVKLFIWESLHGALPVGEQFAIRNIPVSPICPRCREI